MSTRVIRFMLFSLALFAPQWRTADAEETQQQGRMDKLPEWAKESWVFRRQAEQRLALRGGTVIDVQTGQLIKNATIVIAGDIIESVSQQDPPADAKIVDIQDAYVIPGLFDLHAHVMVKSFLFPTALEPEETLRALLNAGVTTIRVLPLHSESALQWAAQINAGHLFGPTIVPASGIFEKERQRTSLGFKDPKTARAWVQKEALLGTRWIKVYNKMDEDSLRTIVQAGREFGMKVCGHTEDVPPLRASELGIGSLEHIISIPLSCFREGAKRKFSIFDLTERTVGRWSQVDDEKLAQLLATFRANGTAWVPTLVASEQSMKSGIHDGVEPSKSGLNPESEVALRKGATAAVKFHREGGLLGLGTDFPIAGVSPGESVHREMQLFVEFGGATPLEALQTATTASARVLGLDSILGKVAPGFLANLVVVKENPLEAVARTRNIILVVHDGRVHEPK